MARSKPSGWVGIALAVLFMVPLALIGCGFDYTTAAGSPGYTELTVKRGIAEFSFEYPSHYRIGKVEIRNDYQYTHVIVDGQSPGREEYFTLISVFVDKVDERVPNVQAATDLALHDENTLLNFHLLERSPVIATMDSLPGEKITYSWTRRNIDQRAVPEHHITSSVIFQKDSLIWDISIRSDEGGAEADEAVFNHIVKTFKILD